MALTNLMLNDSPALVVLLSRAFGEGCIDVISGDYERSAVCGGNRELHGLQREEGVSFRPRIARIVTILLQDFGSRDLPTIRAAVLAAGNIEPEDVVEEGRLAELVRASNPASVRSVDPDESKAIAVALTLDEVRHLHLTALPAAQRAVRLVEAQALASRLAGSPAIELLCKKLEHAIAMQQRGIAAGDVAGSSIEAGEGDQQP